MTRRKETSTNSLNREILNNTCDLAYALDLIGGRWKLLILTNLGDEPVRYSELKKLVPKITERMLALELRALEKNGLIIRNVYASVPPCVGYQLTNLGKSLVPICRQLSGWGAEHRITNNIID
ncbi:helix-turn-helix domain-containing protein [Chitinophaga sp. HK235]|uniref:winged helix-turn-helix transcriptional regulator n=1 Tax=Chitinophaga sp. HK235 TaxID=2952571 RepID=UPI001BADE8A7|nr:helix-turn-helix domain-containing protein [Chitinophaga sp. HK235]